MLELEISILRRQLQLQNKTINLQGDEMNLRRFSNLKPMLCTHLVDAHGDGQALLHGMLEQPLGV